jgi:glycosyltransferase involved in cell wall biosynthesis
MSFNEGASLPSVLEELHRTLVEMNRAFEIVVVDDGSQDGTGAVVRAAQERLHNVRVVRHEENLGLGSVYRTGFREARQDLLTFFPADGQFPAAIVSQFAKAIEGHDAVFGTLDTPVGRLGAALNRAERLLYRAMLGRFPRFQGIVMFRRRILDEVSLRSPGGRGWAVLMELILRIARGPYSYTNAATTLRPRQAGRSKVRNVRTICVNLKQAFLLRWLL